MTTAPDRMHALVVRDRGRPEDTLHAMGYEEVARPEPGIGDVLVEVRASSLTPTELQWPSTWVDRNGRDRSPVIPGHEVSGLVVGLGYGTTGFSPGDPVFGLTDWYRNGSLAEYVVVEARNLAAKPEPVSHPDAAAIPLAGLTAWQALFVHGGSQPGQVVVVHGAGGGVGVLAVQLAKLAGCQVVATGRASARDIALKLGAARFFDLESDRLDELDGQVDVVFDLIGGDVLQRSWRMVRGGGIVVSVIEAPVPDRSDVDAVLFVVEPDRGQLVKLARLVSDGMLHPVVGEIGNLRDGSMVWEAKVDKGLPGKVVLQASV